MRVLRAETLRQVCKESLADVRSLQLHGRGVEQLEGLALCPSLTSLNICRNALTELNEESFARCQELWIIDAAHNQLVSPVHATNRLCAKSWWLAEVLVAVVNTILQYAVLYSTVPTTAQHATAEFFL